MVGGGGATGGQPPVGHGLGALAAAFVPHVYNTQVGTCPVPVPGMSQQAQERERLLEEARLQMACTNNIMSGCNRSMPPCL